MSNQQRRALSRRRFLSESYLGLGSLALLDMLAADSAPAAPKLEHPLAIKPQHRPAKAKNCIFLFMEGGVSQMCAATLDLGTRKEPGNSGHYRAIVGVESVT